MAKLQLTLLAPLLWHAAMAEILLVGTCKAKENTCFVPIGEKEQWVVPDAHEFRAVCGLAEDMRCAKDDEPCYLRPKDGLLANCRVHHRK
ncbi:reverse transcriptase domain protein [Purpureocillium lavendulum]|uniref:Reverse transcriptase domain protein n=1 Tax=Purpureocillium lavendulum TaxID=1247861 RepID=A0AB34FFE7_9HYPO|nr:reverse transcriptase domain protein [Purpureocillium lavendulum]